jgi:prenyl protein peptidase
VIRGRIRAVSITCFLCSAATFAILCYVNNGTPLGAVHLMGYWPVGAEEAVKCVALTAILFLGPLFEGGIVEGAWKDWIRFRGVNQVISGWIGWRNFIAVSAASMLYPSS